ncbi:hypothetical protein EYF80_026654 [Liparis tanakae]|uniref:Uncharacterized protein n=1 Tax=Liparis tanakae TaxID=230148 RepID=A0A4Z2HCF0_9TELE|nr:hypothetical protein EYF80_026654 [Liparis tanakae]
MVTLFCLTRACGGGAPCVTVDTRRIRQQLVTPPPLLQEGRSGVLPPAAMSRYEVSAVSTPTGMTMLMTFSADQFLSY